MRISLTVSDFRPYTGGMVTPVSNMSAASASLQKQGDGLVGLLGGNKSTNSLAAGVASGLVNTSLLSSRPAFELQFNALQNAWIGRISKKVDEYNAIQADENITFDLDLRRASLVDTSQTIGEYVDRAGSNRATMDDLSNSINLLSVESDPLEFIRIRDEIIDEVDRLKTTYIDQFGIPDGLQGLKNKFSSGFDLSTGVNTGPFENLTLGQLSMSDLLEIKSKVDSKTFIVVANRETSLSEQDSIANQLSDIDAAISAKRDGALQAKLDEISKMREQASRILNVISLNFEGQNSLVSQMGSALQPQSASRGSVLNLFS
jgi:hypothetical protein